MIPCPSLRVLVAAVAFAFPTLLEAAGEIENPLQRAQAMATSGDIKGAIELLKSAAEKGSAGSANAVGELYLMGQGVKASAAEAARWFQQATDASFPLGMMNLGVLLQKGAEGVPVDHDKGQFLVRSAAEEGFAPAQVIMGQQAEKGGVDSGDPAEARAWYEKAAAQDEPEGLLSLARFYDQGIGGPRDLAKGFETCRRAALAGSAVAMNEIGVRYQKGLGVPADSTNAIGWFTVAAQRGLSAAQVNLGNCFEVGNGVLQDFAMAGTHYASAARQQFGPGYYLLGQLYERGQGAPANPLLAYVNYSLAAVKGVENSQKKSAEMKAKLSAEQLAEAEKMIAGGGKAPEPQGKGSASAKQQK